MTTLINMNELYVNIPSDMVPVKQELISDVNALSIEEINKKYEARIKRSKELDMLKLKKTNLNIMVNYVNNNPQFFI
jgi:CRP-like cAMP-binding protein